MESTNRILILTKDNYNNSKCLWKTYEVYQQIKVRVIFLALLSLSQTL